MKYSIDGKFLTRKIGGLERYANEIIREMDKIVEKDEVELVIPHNTENIPSLERIKVVKCGKHSGQLFEQLDFYRYIKKNKRIGVYLTNTWSVLRPDVVTIPDAAMKALPNIYNNLYGRLSVLFHSFLCFAAKKKAKVIFTISEFSRSEIAKTMKIPKNNMVVVDCGWQHMERIIPDFEVFTKHTELHKKKYYLSVSSRTPQKNFKWIVECARNNPQCVFAIVGQKVGLTNEDESNVPDNLLYLGRISDEEMKALMIECKAFIHPAIYEGFGMTPLEAASVGAPIIISNAASLPEVYRKAAHYIDPKNPHVDLDSLLNEPVDDIKKVLDRYSWKNNAEKLYEILKTISKQK